MLGRVTILPYSPQSWPYIIKEAWFCLKLPELGASMQVIHPQACFDARLYTHTIPSLGNPDNECILSALGFAQFLCDDNKRHIESG
jgi:hypothetical protein